MISSIDVSIGVGKKSLSSLAHHHFEARLLHNIDVELGYPINNLRVSVGNDDVRTVLVNNQSDSGEALAIGKVLDETVATLAQEEDGRGDDDSDLRELTWKKMSQLLLEKGYKRVLGQKYWVKVGQTQSAKASLEDHDCTLKLAAWSSETRRVQYETSIHLLDCDDATMEKVFPIFDFN